MWRPVGVGMILMIRISCLLRIEPGAGRTGDSFYLLQRIHDTEDNLTSVRRLIEYIAFIYIMEILACAKNFIL